MRQASLAGRTAILAASVSAVVFTLILYRGTTAPGSDQVVSLDPTGWLLLIASLACVVVSSVMAVYARFLRYSMEKEARAARQTRSDGPAAVEQPAQGPEPVKDLSRLPEDERRLYGMIEAAGGEILQMKLVSSGEFSKSKVTRLLDKLENRELIKRERRGMTNLIRLVK